VRDARNLGDFAWATDACPICGPEHAKRGCGAVLPVALLVDERSTVVLAYRCPDGHDWTSGYDRAFALNHAEAARLEVWLEPHWPEASTER